MFGTNLWSTKSSTVQVSLTDKNTGDAMLAKGTVPSAVAGYAKGCIFIETSSGKIYQNTGTASSCTFNSIGDIVRSEMSTAAASKAVLSDEKTIATTSNTDWYITVPETGTLTGIDFYGIDALAANDTNYVTFTVTNLGQAGAGTTVMLAATDANTTKATGGAALAANTKRSLTVHGTAANLNVTAGDRIRIRAAATGTLANTVTGSNYLFRFGGTS